MHPTYYCTLLFLCVLLKFSSCLWQDGDEGVDRPGGNLDQLPVIMEPNHNQRNCWELCQRHKLCKSWSYCKIGVCYEEYPVCFLKDSIPKQVLNPNMTSGVKNGPLLAPKYVRIPVGHITPEGWLKRQLEVQLNGLSGHLQLFWADIENSSWIGGNADTDLHERNPYWMNGVLPLAYQLKNQSLIDLLKYRMEYIMDNQKPDGWLGPDDANDSNIYWSRFMQLLVMVQYYEATEDHRVIESMFKFLKKAHRRMFTVSFGNDGSWTGARWQDFVLSIHWLMDNHPSGQEQFLWDIAELSYQQGYSWKDFFTDLRFPKGSVDEKTMPNQGVNNAMAIKSEGIWYRQSHDPSDVNSTYLRMDLLDKYHGQANGMFTADEHLGGLMPSRGTELCTVVEAMFSYETLFAILGDVKFAERAENITYNALPATITPDMWAHQYIQQSNEMNAVVSEDHIWNSDGPFATLYGLQPNFGCCTVNFNQGWPKMTQSVFMITPKGDTIVVSMYAPASMNYKGASLTITTDYPFDDTVVVTGVCSSPKTVQFRIPSWTKGATLAVGNSTSAQVVAPSSLVSTSCKGSFSVKLIFPMKIGVTRRYKGAASIYRGPLLYAIKIKDKLQVLETYAYQSRDYQAFPMTPWNYAIQLSNDSKPEDDLTFFNKGLGGSTESLYPFSLDGAPSEIRAKGRVLETWGERQDAADEPPSSPYDFNKIRPLLPLSKAQEVILVPYGATNLRIAEIPTYNITFA